MLEGDDNLDRVQCECFRQNPWPYEEFPEVPQKRRRFYHYRTVSWKLGLGPKERADLPGCVRDRIEEDLAILRLVSELISRTDCSHAEAGSLMIMFSCICLRVSPCV